MPEWHTDEVGDVVCEHGTAIDVHCCNCHGGFLFDIEWCVCVFDEPPASADAVDPSAPDPGTPSTRD